MLIKSLKKIKSIIQNKFAFKDSDSPCDYDIIYETVAEDRNIQVINALSSLNMIIRGHASNRDGAAEIYREIANFLLNAGQPEAAATYYEKSLAECLDQLTYSLYLQCLILNPASNEHRMMEVASKYDKLFFSHIEKYTDYSNDLTSPRKISVGYVCHFFHNSVSQSLLIPLLKTHDKERINVYCYSDADPAEVPESIRKIATVWRDTKDLDDAQLASLIREDKIDVLLELNGHCINNRYGMLARKPAPVQVSYYNQCATTGVSAIDYNLIGTGVDLDTSQPFYTETLYYLKGLSGVAVFPPTFPACGEPPFLKNGFITFGSFGASHKINRNVVKAWCDILKQVPAARFYMKAGALTHEGYRNIYKKMFEDEGIDMQRLILEGYSEHHKMLECYANMDIAVDSFPYTAGTTTMEALWQGVPVITLAGKQYAEQNGKVILNSIKHPELIAYSLNEYIEKAITLANTPDRLTEYRRNLREDFRNSSLANPNALADTMESAYLDMWAKYCAKRN